MLNILSYVSGPFVCPPWRSVCSSLFTIFNWVFCFPGVESCEFFIYFGDQTLVWGIIGKYVFPYNQFPFHFDDGFCSCLEAFYFDVVSCVYFFLYFPCPRRYISKNIAMWDIWYFTMFYSRKTYLYLSLLSILSLFFCMV